MARAPRTIDTGNEAPPESDRLDGWPHPRETFALAGHAEAEITIADAIASRRLHHAWLIAGEEGIGKATFAYRVARFLLAQENEDLPGQVPTLALPQDHKAVRQVTNLAHPGLLVMRRAWDASAKKFKQSIAVDDIRQVRHFLQRTSVTPWRVVIVDAADDLNMNSANALLKSLEEPPPRTVFLLVASAPGGLLPTIRSRCRTLHLRPLGAEAITQAVTEACRTGGRDLPPETQLSTLLAMANGSPRRVLRLMDGGGLKLFELLLTILESLPHTDWTAVHKLIAQTGPRAGDAHAMAFDLLEEALADAMNGRLTGNGRHATFPQLKRFSRLITADSLADWSELWETIRQMRGEAERLNLDKAALTLTVFDRIGQTAQKAASARV